MQDEVLYVDMEVSDDNVLLAIVLIFDKIKGALDSPYVLLGKAFRDYYLFACSIGGLSDLFGHYHAYYWSRVFGYI